MIFNKHSHNPNFHAFLSASKYHWIGYDEDKVLRAFDQAQAAARGSRLHALAHDLIREGVMLRESPKTLNMYVNDSIRYRMVPEQLLVVNELCFGTPDAIGFSEKRLKLRISDLKTGASPTSEKQLLVYAAMFCMEYGETLDFSPFDLTTELRIYQNNECRERQVDPMDIVGVIETIKLFTRVLREREAGN